MEFKSTIIPIMRTHRQAGGEKTGLEKLNYSLLQISGARGWSIWVKNVLT